MYDEKPKDIKIFLLLIAIIIVLAWLVQILMIVLKLIGIITLEWIWVFSVTWMTILFFGTIVGGILLFDKLGKDK